MARQVLRQSQLEFSNAFETQLPGRAHDGRHGNPGLQSQCVNTHGERTLRVLKPNGHHLLLRTGQARCQGLQALEQRGIALGHDYHFQKFTETASTTQ
jgi:hypothetical protein